MTIGANISGVQDLAKRISSKKARIAVVGLGYVGLPLIRSLLRAGFKVQGIDVDRGRIALLKSGHQKAALKKGETADLSKAASFPGGVHPLELAPFIKKKSLILSSNYVGVEKAEVVVVCTPTPLGKHQEPDLRYIHGPMKEVASRLKKPTLIILESTSYPGTTRELLPIFDKHRLGKDFFLAFSPERVDPGNTQWHLENIPKLVSGVDNDSKRLATVFYKQFVDQVYPVGSPEVAEMAKLLENIFRLVNISLVNEMTLLADKMGINMWEVIDAAKTKPYGFMPFYPSPGAGGHCIPLDPMYLTWKAKEFNFYPRFIELASEVNNLMPDFAVSKVTYVLNTMSKPLRGSKILVIGAAYKKDVADIRESSALRVIGKLIHKGAAVEFHDPHVTKITVKDPYAKHSTGTHDLHGVPLRASSLRNYDCVVIAVDHTAVDYDLILKSARTIVDLRNILGGRKSKAKIFHL